LTDVLPSLSSYLAELHVNVTAQDVSAFTTAAVQAATFMRHLTEHAYNDILYESLAGSAAADAWSCASTVALSYSLTSAAMFAEGAYVLSGVLGDSTWNQTCARPLPRRGRELMSAHAADWTLYSKSWATLSSSIST
jgi:hypothetical protein